ncbi:MAG: phosphoribosylglycinamide formyltransferase [Prevotella sp.]|jgi:phosphoribosylglycinamide formyltransferase-1|nr:phosphoribosylglycinamide formyltransferase [Prevotella sp.]MCI1281233.1 phosphoribosylglycinamide formyltransferase [Prevotella sp.]
MKKVRLAIFVSGNGTNCENIIRYFANDEAVDVALVVSNKPDAYALVRAKRLGVPTLTVTKEELNAPEFTQQLSDFYHIDLIILGGFLLKVPAHMVEAYDHRMINLHPALLPKYGGKGMYGHHVHEAIKANHEKETGMTVHWVSNDVDGGEIIAQYRTPLTPEDSADDIANKEHELEMQYFPKEIERIISLIFH